MNSLQIELDRLSENIIHGEVDGIQYLPQLENESMTNHDYIHILVRTIFINKVEDRLQKRRRGEKYLIGTMGLAISLLLFVYFNKK